MLALKGGGVTCSRCPALPTTGFSIIGRNTPGLPEGLRGLLIITGHLRLIITGRNAQRLTGGVGVSLIIYRSPFPGSTFTPDVEPAREGHHSQAPAIRNPLRTECNVPSYLRHPTRADRQVSPKYYVTPCAPGAITPSYLIGGRNWPGPQAHALCVTQP